MRGLTVRDHQERGDDERAARIEHRDLERRDLERRLTRSLVACAQALIDGDDAKAARHRRESEAIGKQLLALEEGTAP